MRRTQTRQSPVLVPLLLVTALLLAGCGSSTGVEIGAIRVTVTAVGNNIDADGYVIRVTGEGEDQSRPVETNGQVVFAVQVGRHVVELTDKADNCIVDLNPQVARVSAGETVELLFNTLCG